MSSALDTIQPVESRARVRLLYVEDDVVGARLVKRSLERRPGFAVDLAEDGQRGLELSLASEYDLLLVDNDMPEVGGLELVRALRARGSRVPIIMITGAGDERTAIEALKSGCKDYIVKDGDGSFLHLLPAVIDQVLSQAEAERLLAERNRENQRLLAELLETNKQLKKLNELKNEVLGIAAHDLRNPITAIVTAISYLMGVEDDASSRRHEMLDICRKSSRQALNMIDELLNPNRLESGELELRRESLELADLVCEVVQLNRANADRKRIAVEFVAEREVRGSVDPFRFRELADNILSNAIKYSPPGSTVTARVFRDGARACVAVRDEGPGFTDEDLPHLYKRFRRLSARPTANEPSTGLGLSIVKRIADLHGAEIRLDSSPGRGSEFVVSFPER